MVGGRAVALKGAGGAAPLFWPRCCRGPAMGLSVEVVLGHVRFGAELRFLLRKARWAAVLSSGVSGAEPGSRRTVWADSGWRPRRVRAGPQGPSFFVPRSGIPGSRGCGTCRARPSVFGGCGAPV